MEGAHGVMLDLDFGLYPYSTGSNVISGAVNTGSGVSINKIKDIWGVVKAYTSRVGEGPLPTELKDEVGKKIQEKGAEFGTTTGRPRRVGWLDLEAVRFAVEICGVNKLAITKADVLSGLKEIKVAVGYRIKGKKVSYSECGYLELVDVEPVYETFLGWEEELTGIKSYKNLPKSAKKYLAFIEDFLGVKIALVSTGPAREEYFSP